MAKLTFSDNPLVNYLRATREELGKVVWPGRAKVVKHTAIVIGLSLAVGAFFGALDYGFSTGLQQLLAR